MQRLTDVTLTSSGVHARVPRTGKQAGRPCANNDGDGAWIGGIGGGGGGGALSGPASTDRRVMNVLPPRQDISQFQRTAGDWTSALPEEPLTAEQWRAYLQACWSGS